MRIHKSRSNPHARGEQVASKATERFQHQQTKLALDVHASSIVVERMMDGAKPQPPQTLKLADFVTWAKKQVALAKEVISCYEAGPTGFWLPRQLSALVSANAIQAAPAGLAATVATGAVLASTTISTSTAIATSKTIAMTTIRKTIIVAVVAGAVVVEIYQARQVSKRREQVQTLEHQQEPQAALSRQVQELQREHDRATNALAAENAALKKSPNEVLRTSRRSWKAAAGECQHRLQQCVQQNLRQSRNEKGDARQPEGAVD